MMDIKIFKCKFKNLIFDETASKTMHKDVRHLMKQSQSELNKSVNKKFHCVKSAQIRSFFWPVFSRIRTEYGEILRIWTLFTKCFQKKGPVQKEVPPSNKLEGHPYENLFELKELSSFNSKRFSNE